MVLGISTWKYWFAPGQIVVSGQSHASVYSCLCSGGIILGTRCDIWEFWLVYCYSTLEENVGLLLVGWNGDYNQSHATWKGRGLFCMKTLNCSLEYFMVMHIDATFLVVHKL